MFYTEFKITLSLLNRLTTDFYEYFLCTQNTICIYVYQFIITHKIGNTTHTIMYIQYIICISVYQHSIETIRFHETFAIHIFQL